MPTKCNPLPPQSDLLALFRYEPETGALRSKSKWHPDKVIGKTESNGYIQVKIAGKYFLAQRVIWKMVTGDDPPEFIDHKDTVRSNNRWANLRVATQSKNNHHRRTTNTYGRGVSRARGRFQAKIMSGRNRVYLGCFSSAEAAQAAYESAAKHIFGEFATL